MMFKARHFVIASLVAACSASAALAGPGGPGKSFTVSWQEFRARCANPDSFDNQRDPRQIRLQCTNIEREFVPDKAGVMALGASREVTATVLSDKFNVNSISREYPMAASPATCLRYHEIQKTFTIEKPLSCQDVLSIKGDDDNAINEFCASALAGAKGSVSKLVDIQETGNRWDSCGVAAAGGPDKK